MKNIILVLICCALSCSFFETRAQNAPLPEHPRPDFMRTDWVNLNGTWQFVFDKSNVGISEKWSEISIPI